MRDEAEIVARAIIGWMDAFHVDGRLPPKPSTAAWEDYSKREQATARLAARGALRALDELGEEKDTR